MAEYKFETEEATLREINQVEAKFGMTHEEFVSAAAAFVDSKDDQFKRHLSSQESR